MSDKLTKIERSRAKDGRQTPAPDAPSSGKPKRKRDRPWIVEEKYTDEYISSRPPDFMIAWWRHWRKRGTYSSEAVAMEAVEMFRTQYMADIMEYRVRHRDECVK